LPGANSSTKTPIGPVVQGKMTHWKQDTDLAGARDPNALQKLPADERDAWQKLWKDVDTLLAQAQEKKQRLFRRTSSSRRAFWPALNAGPLFRHRFFRKHPETNLLCSHCAL
jgi:hypothetical protein